MPLPRPNPAARASLRLSEQDKARNKTKAAVSKDSDTPGRAISSKMCNAKTSVHGIRSCKGGSSKVCGVEIRDAEAAIQCDKCSDWFHISCQQVSALALKAVEKYRPTVLWLCNICKVWIKNKDQISPLPSGSDKDGLLQALEAKVDRLIVSTNQGLDGKLDELHNDLNNRMQCIEHEVKCQAAMLKDQPDLTPPIIHFEESATRFRTCVEKQVKIVEELIQNNSKSVTNHTKLMEKSLQEHQSFKTSYADIVKGSCDKVVETVTKKVEAAQAKTQSMSNKDAHAISEVVDDIIDREKRKLNLVVHNLPEQARGATSMHVDDDATAFINLVKDAFRLNIRISKLFRAGKASPDKPRLLIVTLENEQTRHDILKMAPQLRNSVRWNNIYISPDLTWKEREENRALREELRHRRGAGETDLTIRRNKIVSKARIGVRHPELGTRGVNSSSLARSPGLLGQHPLEQHNSTALEARTRPTDTAAHTDIPSAAISRSTPEVDVARAVNERTNRSTGTTQRLHGHTGN